MKHFLFLSLIIASGTVVFIFTTDTLQIASVIGIQSKPAQTCVDTLNTHNNTQSTVKEYEVSRVRINDDSRKDILLKKITSCGSAGCIHELCLIQSNNRITIVPFGYASKELTLKETITNGMYDIHLAGNSAVDLQWNGSNYQQVN